MQDIIEEYAEKRAQMAVAEAERENNKKIVVKLSAKGMSVEEIASIFTAFILVVCYNINILSPAAAGAASAFC